MNRDYASVFCPALGHDLEMLVFGNSGKPVLVFPSSEGRFFDWENFGMVSTTASFIEEGKIRVFCIDGVDSQSWYSKAHPADRARRANDYDWAISHDIVPFIQRNSPPDSGIMTHGCSFGAYHAANFYLKHPDLFDSCLALSGNYSIGFAVDGFCNGDVYHNDPLMYLPHLQDQKILDQLREDLMIIVCGQGAWEDWLGEAKAVSSILHEKFVPHLLDLWGHDVNHDWPWWKQQIVYHLGKLDRAGMLGWAKRINRQQVNNFLQHFSTI